MYKVIAIIIIIHNLLPTFILLYKINQDKEVKDFVLFLLFLDSLYVYMVGGGVYLAGGLPSLGCRCGRSSLHVHGLEKVHMVVMF